MCSMVIIDKAHFQKARGLLVRCILAPTPDYEARAMAGAPGWLVRLSGGNERLERALEELVAAPELEADDAPVRAILAASHRAGPTSIVKHRAALRASVLAGWKKERVAHVVEELYWSGLILSKQQPFTALHSSSGKGPFAIDEAIACAYFPGIDLEASPDPLPLPPPAPALPAALPLDVRAWKERVHAIDPDDRVMAWRDAIRHNETCEPLPFALLRELHDPRWTNVPLFFDYKGEFVGSRDPAAKPRQLGDLAARGFKA